MRVRRTSVLFLSVVAALSVLPALTTVANAQPVRPAHPTTGGATLTDSALYTDYRSVVTSAKRKLQVNVAASVSADGRSFTVRVQTAGDGESHEWEFTPPERDLDLALPGKLTLSSSALGPFGRIHLTIARAGKTTTTKCDASDYATDTPVKVFGNLLFTTGTGTKTGWGAVEKTGKHTISFSGRDSLLERDYGGGAECSYDDLLTNCDDQSDSYITSYSDLGYIDSYYERAHGSVDMSRTVNLAKPKGARRTDFASVPIDKPTVIPLGTGGAEMTVKVKGGKRASGSYTVTSAQPGTSESVACYQSTTAHGTATSTSWSSASFANGSTPLQIKDQVFGALRFAKASTTELPRFSTITYP